MPTLKTQTAPDEVGENHAPQCRPAPKWAASILFAQDDLKFRPIEMPDPVPLGRQILAAGGVNPHDGYSLFAILPTGDFEDLRLDEPFDLRGRGAERFVAFQ